MRVLLISGKAESGKDTFANLLKNELTLQNKKVLICHYADLVKYVATNFFDWNGKKDEYGRTLLQEIGTEKVRNMFPNFWVDFITNILKVFYKSWDCVLIPDTRFPNEIEIPISRGLDVSTVRITRPNHISSLNKEQLIHPSETILDDYKFTYYVENQGEINDLKSAVKDFAELLKREM